MNPMEFTAKSRHPWTYLAGLLFAVTLAGCRSVADAPLGMEGMAIERDYGKPSRIWPESGGGASWEYVTGPAGQYTYMARLDGSGRLIRTDQVLDWLWFRKIE